jgi:hypothetical protein
MMSLRMLVAAFAVALPLTIAPALAQKASSPDPGPEEESIARMVANMHELRDEMRRMHEDMKGAGMGPMHGRLGRMADRMDEMRAAMELHRTRIREQCSGMRKPSRPGG